MNEHVYHIHNLITVRVNEKVRPWVLKSINRQLGSFKSDNKNHSNPLMILVNPFDMFSFTQDREIFQNSEGGKDSWYANRESRLAIEKIPTGYAVYTDAMFSFTGLIQQLFISKGISFAHAAALQNPSGGVTILAGSGGVGKTALSGFLVKEKGYKLLGDDMIALTELGMCLAFHKAFVLKEYHRSVYPELFATRKHMSLQKRATRFIIWHLYANVPFRGIIDKFLKSQGVYNRIAFIPFIRKDSVDVVPAEQIFPAECLATQGPVVKTILLLRCSVPDFLIEEQNGTWMARRMFAILYQELENDLKRLLEMGSLGLEDLGVNFWRARTILEKAVSRTPCRVLRIPEKATPEELARAFEQLGCIN
ncbi:MAG: hypothetical protein AAB352_03750 [Patescibacteria group bacterium]